jgi:F0F1-type ATP synthase epsilon subunit
MKLQIITSQKTTEINIDWIEFNTPVGNMVIQEGHAPMIIELASGYELLYQTKHQGVAHVTRTGVKILLPIDL